MGIDYTYRQIIRILKDDGWQLDRQVGSHEHWVHPTKPGLVTVKQGSKSYKRKTLQSMFLQAGLKWPPR